MVERINIFVRKNIDRNETGVHCNPKCLCQDQFAKNILQEFAKILMENSWQVKRSTLERKKNEELSKSEKQKKLKYSTKSIRLNARSCYEKLDEPFSIPMYIKCTYIHLADGVCVCAPISRAMR